MKTLGLIALFAAMAASLAWGFWPRQPPTRIHLEGAAAPAIEADEIVYYCRETRAFSKGARAKTPAVNPATGRATLTQALYCPTCRRWWPVPPSDRFDRPSMGPTCPKEGTPLEEQGPFP